MVEVFYLMGQQVMVSEDDTIDLDSVGQGIYFVRVTAEGKVVTKRIVKQ